MRLFILAEADLPRFVQVVNELGGVNLDPNEYWEIGYEVCFFRDIRKSAGQHVPLISPKRTFDLCLMSEKHLVIIEAKCAERFNVTQLNDFSEDLERFETLKKFLPEFDGVSIITIGLVAENYLKELQTSENQSYRKAFTTGTKLMTWEDVSKKYRQDKELEKAGKIFEGTTVSFSKNNQGGYLSGIELEGCLIKGSDFWIGRRGGLKKIQSDINEGKWQRIIYQTNHGKIRPNVNWIKLSELGFLLKKDE
jgi:hypothetical protein